MRRRPSGRTKSGASIAVRLALLLGFGLLQPHPATAQEAEVTPRDAQWAQDLQAWRAAREQEISAPDGWLTLVGLDWLKPGANPFGTAADNQICLRALGPEHMGLLTVSGKPQAATAHGGAMVQLLSPVGGFPPDLLLNGVPAREGPLETDGPKPPIITWHGVTLAVLNRGGRYALRVKDTDATARTSFHGLNWYAPDPHLRIDALWIPFATPRVEKIPTVLGTTIDLPTPGTAEFTLGDKTYRLEPVIEDPSGKTLFFILRDETGKTTTYETARYLHTGLPDHGLDQPGLLTLDFNRLENPPCAYTPYATCPLPPEKNRLAVAIEAGEKRYAP